MTGEQDRVDLTSARVEVEKQTLEVSTQEIVSKLQGEASRVDLGLAEEKQRVTQASADLHRKSEESKIASLTRQRDKAQQDIDVTKRRFFFQAEDGIRGLYVTGVQTCALPI